MQQLRKLIGRHHTLVSENLEQPVGLIAPTGDVIEQVRHEAHPLRAQTARVQAISTSCGSPSALSVITAERPVCRTKSAKP